MFAYILRSNMIVANNLSDFNSAREQFEGKVVGFVPTMGALHEGHASLMRKAVQECDAVVVSIFVNPTQFNNQNDFNTYPRTLEKDCSFVESLGVKLVFAPGVQDVYPQGSGFDTKVYDLGGLDQYGEGPRRPGHFNGMAQIVTRLFDIVRPSKAYFGEKDFQQLAIIEYFTKNLNYPIEIVRCPIARGEDGLALSSRNELLTPEQRAVAPHIYKCISSAVDMVGKFSVDEVIKKVTEAIDSEKLLETEYVEIINSLTLQPISDWNEAEHIRLSCAVFAHPVRLIDNINLK